MTVAVAMQKLTDAITPDAQVHRAEPASIGAYAVNEHVWDDFECEVNLQTLQVPLDKVLIHSCEAIIKARSKQEHTAKVFRLPVRLGQGVRTYHPSRSKYKTQNLCGVYREDVMHGYETIDRSIHQVIKMMPKFRHHCYCISGVSSR